MSEPLTHDQAIDALCGCAMTVTILSYQEAIEGYFKLRDIELAAVDAMSARKGVGDARKMLDAIGELAMAINPHSHDARQRQRIAAALHVLVDAVIEQAAMLAASKEPKL